MLVQVPAAARRAGALGLALDIENVIQEYPSASQIGTPGFPFPAGNWRQFDPSDPDELTALKAFGVSVANAAGGNTVLLDPATALLALEINFDGRTGCTVIASPGASLRARVHFQGDRAIVVFCGGEYDDTYVLCAADEQCFYCGPFSYLAPCSCWIEGVGRSLMLGTECMFGWSVGIRTGDFHTVYDLGTGAKLNEPASTVVGPHVWLSQGVQVLKGVHIGAGAVVGAGAIVSKDVPPSCLAAGLPARVVRKNVGWSRASFTSSDERATFAARDYMIAAASDAGPPLVTGAPKPRMWLNTLRSLLGRLLSF